MPPLPPASQTLRTELEWSVGVDIAARSILFWRYSGGPPSASDASTLATEIYAAGTGFQPLYQEGISLIGCTVTDLSASDGAQATHEATAPGQREGTGLAGATAVLANYTIARRYRGGKPRNYFPWGVGQDLSNQQQWGQGFLTACTNAWTTFTGAVIGATGGSTAITSHANVSYYSGSRVVTSPTTGRARNVPIPRSTPQVDTIVGFSFSATPATQRRRNR
jgi:hypothetical protein